MIYYVKDTERRISMWRRPWTPASTILAAPQHGVPALARRWPLAAGAADFFHPSEVRAVRRFRPSPPPTWHRIARARPAVLRRGRRPAVSPAPPQETGPRRSGQVNHTDSTNIPPTFQHSTKPTYELHLLMLDGWVNELLDVGIRHEYDCWPIPQTLLNS
jgi:hypothetical protein